MTDEELKQLVAGLAVAQQKTERQMQETDRRMQETDRLMQEAGQRLQETERIIKESQRETDKQLKELGKQIGGLGDKFGSFTEGMAFPSMQKVLSERFGMEAIAPRYRVRRGGKCLELDVFAYCNGAENKAIIVEVKSHLRDEHIEQLLRQLGSAKELLPEHAQKQFYGILAVVDAPEDLKQKALRQGLYYAEIHDDLFEVKTPAEFQARAF